MLLNKRLKAFPIRDLMPTPLLIVRDGSTVASLLFAEEPEVERIATDVEHLAHISFALAAFDSSNRFAAQVVTVRGGHQRFLLGFISLLYVLTLTSRAILFLASDEAAFITGVALPVDGGNTAQ